ncbi:hypothetical protein PsYK624_135430 [Phanerochaete sordida]|uniref:Uncharacterized protein n=1 Tax=Phanerochaete sordida TaxID=48140 RepID=A0A9P3GKT0_9APHY|nr:hypothetical protein PsYK624_135430 [Phanerochaete sordida]
MILVVLPQGRSEVGERTLAPSPTRRLAVCQTMRPICVGYCLRVLRGRHRFPPSRGLGDKLQNTLGCSACLRANLLAG